jgi:hypothetical protein
MITWSMRPHVAAAMVVLGLSACAESPVEPEPLSASLGQSSANCVNVAFKGDATLGLWAYPGGGGALGFGGVPEEMVTFGPYTGTFGSILTSETPSGQGAVHYTLIHFIQTADGMIQTADRAVCAPSGPDVSACRVSDVLTIVGGTGIFEGAYGQLRNRGIITITGFAPPEGTLTVDLRGRICTAG